MANPIFLRVLVMREEVSGSDVWLTVALEHYIMAQGKSPDEAIEQFKSTLAAEIMCGLEQGNPEQPLGSIGKAPDEYWDAYKTGTPLDPPSVDVNIEVQRDPVVTESQTIELRTAA